MWSLGWSSRLGKAHQDALVSLASNSPDAAAGVKSRVSVWRPLAKKDPCTPTQSVARCGRRGTLFYGCRFLGGSLDTQCCLEGGPQCADCRGFQDALSVLPTTGASQSQMLRLEFPCTTSATEAAFQSHHVESPSSCGSVDVEATAEHIHTEGYGREWQRVVARELRKVDDVRQLILRSLHPVPSVQVGPRAPKQKRPTKECRRKPGRKAPHCAVLGHTTHGLHAAEQLPCPGVAVEPAGMKGMICNATQQGFPLTSCELPCEPLPLEPCSGSTEGGTRLRWIGQHPAPMDVFIGGRPCAALRGGFFVTPMQRALDGGSSCTHTDVVLEDAAGARCVYKGSFTYWAPGEILAVDPPDGPVQGVQHVRVSTTDLGACISEVRIGGVVCQFCGTTTAVEAIVQPPAAGAEGPVVVEVFAPNGNCAILEAGFSYYVPDVFGFIGDNVALSQDAMTASRFQGVNRAVCLSSWPLRTCPTGRYFEVHVEEVCKSIRAIAVGVCVLSHADMLRGSKVFIDEAWQLKRAWVAGYDRGGARFFADGQELKIPEKAWRPAKCVVAGSRIGVLWTQEACGPHLVIFQDGVERVCLQATGRLPGNDEELHAVVDLQGTTTCVRLLQRCMPPRRRDGESVEKAVHDVTVEAVSTP